MQNNKKIKEEQKLDSYDYLEKAENAVTEKDAIKYAQKALKLDPYCLDADFLIAQVKAESIDNLITSVEKIIRKGEEQLIEKGISMEEDAGSFYGILETRPYMRIRKTYLDLLLEMGRFHKAMGEAEELIRLSQNDNLGVRYTLMALYSYFEEEEKALELLHEYQEDSAFMLLPLIALYYKMDNIKKMRKYIAKLINRNPDLKEALDMLLDSDYDEDEISDIMSLEMYRPFSKEEVILAISQAAYLYMPMNHFLSRLYEEIVS